jgi:hypothetical protein
MIHRKFYSILNVSWRMSSLALIIHRDRAPAWRDVSAALRILVLGTGYEGGPAGGPGGRGFHGPWGVRAENRIHGSDQQSCPPGASP